MHWKTFHLVDDDRARSHFLSHLELAAYEHVLSKKLIELCDTWGNDFTLIAYDNAELDRVTDFRMSPYYDGVSIYEATKRSGNSGALEHPISGMIGFIRNQLAGDDNRLAILENACARRSDPYTQRELCTDETVFFGNNIYHIVAECYPSQDLVDETIRRADTGHWWIGVISSSRPIVSERQLVETQLDAIVRDASHVFTGALDGDAYLVWNLRTDATT